MKKNTLAIVILILSISGVTNAQKWLLTRYEVHFGLGTTNAFTDIGGASDRNNWYGLKDIKIKETGPSFYLGLRYKTRENQAIKLNLILGTANSSDAGSVNEWREYSYKTMIFEPSLQYEYYFITETRRYGPAQLYNRRGMINNYSLLAFYAFGGVGGLYYSPKFSHTNANIPNPLIENTVDYNKFTAVFPIGLGAKIAYNKYWSFGFEIGRRFVLSDYIDGFSSSKFSKANDTYYFSTIHVIYKLETDRYGMPLLLKRKRPRFK